MIIERSKLNSRQKRNIFKKRFGDILLKEGFVYSNNCFIRIHPKECILKVGLYIARVNCYVVFDAIPFCCEELVYNLTSTSSTYRVDSFHKKSGYSFEEYYLKSFENGRFELQLELFNLFIKERFLEIKTVAQLLAFENEIIFPVLQDAGRWYSKMLECMQLQEYEKANDYIQKMRNHVMSCLKAEGDDLEASLRWLKSKKAIESTKAFYEEYAERCKENIKLCDFWEHMIVHKEYDRILDIINARIDAANDFCKEKWSEFYK